MTPVEQQVIDADPVLVEREPLVSCIIPTFNGARLISATIEGCLRQTYGHREVIVVDDGSTDETLQFLRQFGVAVTVIRQRNRGVSVARNIGAHYSRGSLLCFCDADDLWLPNKLERQVETLAAQQLASAVHTDFEPFGDEGSESAVNAVSEWRAGRFQDSLSSLWYRNRIIVSSMMVRRSAFIRAGGFRAGLFYPADWMLWTALEEIGPILYLDELLTRYRLHPASSSVAMRPQHILEMIAAKFFHQILFASKLARGEAEGAGCLGTNLHQELDCLLKRLEPTQHHERIRRFTLQLGSGFWAPFYLRSGSLVLARSLRGVMQRLGFSHK